MKKPTFVIYSSEPLLKWRGVNDYAWCAELFLTAREASVALMNGLEQSTDEDTQILARCTHQQWYAIRKALSTRNWEPCFLD